MKLAGNVGKVSIEKLKRRSRGTTEILLHWVSSDGKPCEELVGEAHIPSECQDLIRRARMRAQQLDGLLALGHV